MTGDEFSETAKAAQEIAKATKTGIEATEKLGTFVSGIIGEPVQAVVGILSDKLKFVRWERQLRLTARAKELIKKKNIKGDLRIVPPKIALPIIENASLEENDELQDLWACLISSAVDPTFEGEIRSAFIEIIKQLEVTDVHVLSFINEHYLKAKSEDETQEFRRFRKVEPDTFAVEKIDILSELKINEKLYKESIDNLVRLGCISPFIGNRKLDVPLKNQNIRDASISGLRSRPTIFGKLNTEQVIVNITHPYNMVCITWLGVSFVHACMKPHEVKES